MDVRISSTTTGASRRRLLDSRGSAIFPSFFGGAFGVVYNSPSFGGCWKLTNKATNVSIIIIVVDRAWSDFTIGRYPFIVLNGGQIVGVLDVTVVAEEIDRSYRGL